ncbi:AlwI family type II restriction endonuclease [Mycoplasma sp. HU2014]|uniref:AlwI family type II restriction endonuclease n=1 Tax=Mycoplasma sp. HU2014 TaxID=1664275 RepID=UPI00067B16CB|nr:AlwI family type II restriction endonuclease [Mycoplasma sp. HU2014]KNG79189.1 type II restriction modification system endonuclease subunit [Mycoplasma sp. HU2014]
MKLEKVNSIFNLGDTSIRVKQIVGVNKVILEQLNIFMNNDIVWNKNKETQEIFYRSFINEIVQLEDNNEQELFADFKRLKNYKYPEDSKKGLRARTLTNNLLKIGFIDSQRNLSTVGSSYIKNNITQADELEKMLMLSTDNLVYLRQLLKLRIYSHNSGKYFYPFRIALKILCKYENVEQNHFLAIIQSIRPNFDESYIEKIINNYQLVLEQKITFEEFYNQYFLKYFIIEQDLSELSKKFSLDNWHKGNLSKIFYNNKSTIASQLYVEFISSLLVFKNTKTEDNLRNLIDLSYDERIKKAFGFNAKLFVYKEKDSVSTFLRNNKNNFLLDDDNSKIYTQFIYSKTNDLIKEYSDITKRLFEITGLINFNNKLVNLVNRIVIDSFINIANKDFKLCGEDNLYYETGSDSIWFSDVSVEEIFDISDKIPEIKNTVKKRLNINLNDDLNRVLELQKQINLKNFIYNNFPKEKIIDILINIINRNDDKVFKHVTTSATIPTIFEYIISIAWFYISKNKDYDILKSFGVSLDSNNLPLLHKPGYYGDIEIISKDYNLLIEATLMNPSNQKRAEIEPVIRHSVNFNANYKGGQTIFVANQLDSNVLNIFRSCQFIELQTSNKNKITINGINIFAISTSELIEILKKDISDERILEIVNRNLNKNPVLIKNNWRDPIIEEIFN